MPTIALVLLGCLALGAEPSASPPTRLYVRTVPPGAKVSWKGKLLGKSDAIFSVVPGTQTVLVELDGYLPEERRVEIRAEEVTRVELQLKRRPETAGQTGTPTRQGRQSRCREERRCCLEGGKRILGRRRFACAGSRRDAHGPSPAPNGKAVVGTRGYNDVRHRRETIARADRFGNSAVPAMLNLTGMLAFQELLKAKSLLDRYAAIGLTDATTLQRAVMEAAGKLR